MTTKPEGPAQEPQRKRMMRLPPNSNYPGYVGAHTEDDWCAKAGCIPMVVPATPAPSQPAGARPRDLRKRGDDYKAAWELAEAELEALAEQTAAKDAELKACWNQLCDIGFMFDVVTPENNLRLAEIVKHKKEAAERERDSLREANARLAADLNAALRPGSRTADQYRAELIIAAQKRLATITQCPNCNSSDRAKDVTGSHHDSSGMDIHLDRCEHPWHAVRYEDDSYEMLSMGLPNYPQFDKGWVKEMQKAAFQYELAALKARQDGQQ